MITKSAPYLLEFCDKADAESCLSLLSPAELKVYSSLKTAKRRLDWLSGRAAAKRALGRYFDALGEPTAPAEIEIFNDDAGRPHCRTPRPVPPTSIIGGGRPGPLLRTRDAPCLSISHTALGGLCAVAASGRIGADWEMIAPRDMGVYEIAFHESELTPGMRGDPAALTKLWTLKEAVLKFLGTGLLCSPKDVRFIVGTLTLEGKALAAWTALGRPAIKTESMPRADSVVSLAYS